MFTLVSPYKRSSDATRDRMEEVEGKSRQYLRADGYYAAEVENDKDALRLVFRGWKKENWT